MTDTSLTQAWVTTPERGSVQAIKLGAWIALRLGRRAARLFLYPVCLYFVITSPAAARHSRAYLARVLQRKPRIADIFGHFLTFAGCLLDRVFLLNEQSAPFDVSLHGEDIVASIERQGGGCLLFGAHFGSFEVARALGRQRELPVSLLMYEANAQKIRAALGAINPKLETEVIGLGRLDSLLTVAERLERGHFIGVLADRNVSGEDLAPYPFLGAEAAFPTGPFRVAMLLKKPVVMMVGVYRGGNRYEVHFELLGVPSDSATWLDDTMRHYVARLEHYCHLAPFNWFNFYDFWG